MDPAHRDRVAFLRVCSGSYKQGMKMRHVRIGKTVQVANAITFQADERRRVEEAWPGDIIGLHNHGTIQIGDTFTEGEDLKYEGIPYFAPELFRRVVLKDPLKTKALQKGVLQLCEEGATQVFRPLKNNDLILGAVGVLQFDVAAYRLKDEYGVEAVVEPVSVHTARWVACDDDKDAGALQGQGLREPGPGRRRPARLPGADAGQSATDRGALAGHSLFWRRGSCDCRWRWGSPRPRVPQPSHPMRHGKRTRAVILWSWSSSGMRCWIGTMRPGPRRPKRWIVGLHPRSMRCAPDAWTRSASTPAMAGAGRCIAQTCADSGADVGAECGAGLGADHRRWRTWRNSQRVDESVSAAQRAHRRCHGSVGAACGRDWAARESGIVAVAIANRSQGNPTRAGFRIICGGGAHWHP
jgi:hypothetical protein